MVGGDSSELRERLATARQYLSYDAVTRASQPDTEWEALRSVLACDVPAPEWICATGDAAAEKEARLQLEKRKSSDYIVARYPASGDQSSLHNYGGRVHS